jgi:hypothetical protein
MTTTRELPPGVKIMSWPNPDALRAAYALWQSEDEADVVFMDADSPLAPIYYSKDIDEFTPLPQGTVHMLLIQEAAGYITEASRILVALFDQNSPGLIDEGYSDSPQKFTEDEYQAISDQVMGATIDILTGSDLSDSLPVNERPRDIVLWILSALQQAVMSLAETHSREPAAAL